MCQPLGADSINGCDDVALGQAATRCLAGRSYLEEEERSHHTWNRNKDLWKSVDLYASGKDVFELRQLRALMHVKKNVIFLLVLR